MAICWLLNVTELCVGWLLLVADVRMLPAYYVLVARLASCRWATLSPSGVCCDEKASHKPLAG